MSKIIRKRLTIQQKKEILRLYKSKKYTQKELSTLFKVSPSTVSVIIKEEKQITNIPNFLDGKKSRKTTKNVQMETFLDRYITQCRSNNIPVTRDMIQENAKIYSQKTQNSNFAASNGWFNNFKNRVNLTRKTLCGEEKFVSPETINNFRTFFRKYF